MTATMDAPAEHRTDGFLSAPETSADERAAQWAQDVWTARARRLAVSAQRAVRVFPEVDSARFGIDGVPSAPQLSIDCIVRPGEDTAAVIETITCKVVEDLEQLLDARFATRRIDVSVVPEPALAGADIVRAA